MTTLAPASPACLEDRSHVVVVGHAGLVEHHHVAGGEGQPAVLDPPAQRGHGAGRRSGLAAQGPRRLARDRGAQHLVAGVTEGLGDRRHDRGLARPGHPGDELDALARGADAGHRVALGGGQGIPRATSVRCDGGRAPACRVTAWGRRCARPGRPPGARSTARRPAPRPSRRPAPLGGRRVGGAMASGWRSTAVDHLGQLGRVPAVEVGDDGDDHVAAARTPCASRARPSGPSTSAARPVDLVGLQASGGRRCARGQAASTAASIGSAGWPTASSSARQCGKRASTPVWRLYLPGVSGRHAAGLVGGVAQLVDRLVDLGPALRVHAPSPRRGRRRSSSGRAFPRDRGRPRCRSPARRPA